VRKAVSSSSPASGASDCSVKYAEICGALGIRVTDASQLDDAFTAAAAHHGPTLIEVVTDPELI
jgi:thiamine pyrophosphate-dependent acetolactate synthase large subunit-like protein